MAAEATPTRPLDPVQQFSVFTENRVGRLHELASVFKQGGVHIIAMTVLDTSDSAIVRIIVDDPDKARELMINNDFPYTETSVLAVEFAELPDLKGILSALLEAEINIHYLYSFIKRPEGRCAVAINVEDGEIATQALSRRGYKILMQSDIAR